jgi:hypothetical protein
VVLAATPAVAIDLEKLVMPGKVIEGHADIEAECARCHAPFRDAAQESLCLDCHEEVGADRKAGTGFHGRAPGVRGAACRDCHSEHRGRAADIVGLDRAGFDHRFTDYPLRGAHQRLGCEACHARGQPLREAPSSCVDCHRDDDAHGGKLGADCASCHGEKSWREARFDHDQTHFPLLGKHDAVDCALCHPGNRFEKTASTCLACHRLNDEHLGRFGPRCEDCHSPTGWGELHFDHARDTRFALGGGHRGAPCSACHKGVLHEEHLSTKCVSCHRTDDVHRGRHGNDCERCHSDRAWTAEKFAHERMTNFPLRGAHAELKCERCHTGRLAEQKLSTRCTSCHEDDDVHAGQQGSACETCHNEQGWAVKVFFEHDLGRFPLLGLHAVATCEQCHASARFQDAETECGSCHREDDVHLARLGANCGACHNPNGWQLWQFDHDRQTRFALRGAHLGMDCHACHRAPVTGEIRLPLGCRGCHADEDPHHGAFGTDCARCHSDDDWRRVRVGR